MSFTKIDATSYLFMGVDASGSGNGIVSVNAYGGVGAFVVTQGQRVLCQAADECFSRAKKVKVCVVKIQSAGF